MDEGLTSVESGHGPAVALVHGALGDYRQWAQMAEVFAQHYRVVAVSRRHHWPNAPPHSDIVYSYDSHRDDLIARLRSFDHPAHLVGHSYGAGIALLAAVTAPALVRSLVLIEAPFGSLIPQTAVAMDDELASRIRLIAEIRALVGAGHDAGAAKAFMDWAQGGADGFQNLPDFVKEGLLANARTIGPTFSLAAPEVKCDALKSLSVPTLVVRGERTRMWFRLISEGITACIPGAESAAVPAAGHMVIVERPQETADAVLRFLLRH